MNYISAKEEFTQFKKSMNSLRMNNIIFVTIFIY